MAGRSKEQLALARRGNEILRHRDGALAAPADFDKPNVVLFVHGFTADARYMSHLMSQFADAGFEPLVFNYACFDGIDVAAASLAGLLTDLDAIGDGAINRNRFILVCHSMGGLVGRALISLESGDRFVRKLITLGTPHGGTLTEPKFVEYLLAWGESVSGLVQGGFSMRARSALQLVGRDPDKLLERLRLCEATKLPVDFFSVSAGLEFIEFGKSGFINRAANLWIQTQMAGLANDGLVAESSSNLSQAQFRRCAPGCVHSPRYPEWARTNHSSLLINYRVGLIAIKKAKEVDSWTLVPSDGCNDKVSRAKVNSGV